MKFELLRNTILDASREIPAPRQPEQDSRCLIVIVAVASAVLLPIVFLGVPNGADLPNHLRFVQPFYEAFQSGHWHPGWLAESNNGFGDPRFRFYPPGLYYLLIGARAFIGNWYAANIVTFVFLSIVGALGTYFWARCFCSSQTAMWAAILYAIAPYHLNELYQAALLSEYAACAILPFAFAFTERVCRDRKVGDIAGLAASFALLVLTHLPLAVIGSISLVIYFLLRVERKHFFSTKGSVALAVVLGLAASAFFWTTMLAELSWIKGNSAEPNPYYDYRLNFLFSSNALTNRNTWYANLLALALIGFLLPAIALVRRFVRDRGASKGLRASFVLTIASFLFATALSRSLWAVIPKLSEVQFPWRWLSITSLAGSLVVAASLAKWKEIFRAHVRPRNLAVAFVFALSLFFIVTQIVVDCDYLDRARFDSMARDVRGAASFKDWLPVAARDLVHLDLKKSKVDAGSRSVMLQSWEPEQRQFHVAPGEGSEARVRTYYYPLWVAKANGQTLPTRAGEDGAILISLPATAVDVTLEFQEPPRVHVAEMVSLLTWLLIGALFLSRLVFATWPSRDAVLFADSR